MSCHGYLIMMALGQNKSALQLPCCPVTQGECHVLQQAMHAAMFYSKPWGQPTSFTVSHWGCQILQQASWEATFTASHWGCQISVRLTCFTAMQASNDNIWFIWRLQCFTASHEGCHVLQQAIKATSFTASHWGCTIFCHVLQQANNDNMVYREVAMFQWAPGGCTFYSRPGRSKCFTASQGGQE